MSESEVSSLASHHRSSHVAPIGPGETALEKKEATPRYKLLEETELLLAFTFFGIAGSIARDGLVELLSFEDLGSVWPNFTGCFVMGFHPAVVGSVLAVPVATGFCGAMTSFSELVQDVYLQATSPTPEWPDHGYGVPLFMGRLILELCCCFAAYTVGGHFGLYWKDLGLTNLSPRKELAVMRVCEVLGIAAWVVCLVTAITSPNANRWWPLSGLFAPFGVWMRYYLSKINKPARWFKWGTFAANVFATLVVCVLQTCIMLPQVTPLQQQFLKGLQRGFCGSLSTISTFIKEMNLLPTKYGYIYGIVSLFTGYSLAFIIIGSYQWTR